MANNCPAKSPVVQLIESHRYPVEVQDGIVTEDGYVLTAYRIPRGRNETPTENPQRKPVVLLMHGLLINCGEFVLAGPERSLAFVLSDSGFDVWLPHTRGKTDSRHHQDYLPERDEDYWKFSFHDVALYDIPAFFDRIRKVTETEAIAYIGHSSGTVSPFVLIPERPEYAKQFSLIIGINPVVVSEHSSSPPYLALYYTRHVWLTVMEKLGSLEFPPRLFGSLVRGATTLFGNGGNGVFMQLATQFFHVMHGRTPDQVVKEDIGVLLKHFFDPTSAIVMKHFGQIYGSGLFRKFDCGPKSNLLVYGKEDPPLYDLSKVTCPVVLFSCSEDVVAASQDVGKLGGMLPNCVAVHDLQVPKFNHTDVLFGRYAATSHPLILGYLNRYCRG